MSKLIHKVCVANRGEIACRIIRACHKQGMSTVVLYSRPDAEGMAVKMADEAICLEGTSALESYLSIEKVIAATLKSGAQALHPGYGFLSENAELARACQEAGIIFIGPDADAISKMGMKNVARAIVQGLGLPIVPGYNGDEQSLTRFQKEAKTIGYPILLKASAGGGGKGMQIVAKESELEAAFHSAKRNAQSAFGNGDLLIEKYFSSIKHVEIQVLGDEYGKVIHLFERECSVQRRHQKIIEETPSPALNPQLRQEMGQAAVLIARSVNYVGAGTVEFILDVENLKFYFLEMNTRIQVEHPITEMVTGFDLVEWQLKIARGVALEMQQDDIVQSGHAIECRLYAEDWQKDFLPGSGKVVVWKEYQASGIRMDHAVVESGDVSIYYDPMLAKIIAHGSDRAESLQKMLLALSKTRLMGLTTNQSLLQQILVHGQFESGSYDTGFISKFGDQIKTEWQAKVNSSNTQNEIVMAAWLYQWRLRHNQQALKMGLPSGWRNVFYGPQKDEFELAGEKFKILYRELVNSSARQFEFQINQEWSEEGNNTLLLLDSPADDVIYEMDNRRLSFGVGQYQDEIFIHHADLGVFTLTQIPRFPELEQAASANSYRAPMPGKIVKISVRTGDKVNQGDELIIIESMKMENSVAALQSGMVKDIFVSSGQLVEKNDQLIQFEGDM